MERKFLLAVLAVFIIAFSCSLQTSEALQVSIKPNPLQIIVKPDPSKCSKTCESKNCELSLMAPFLRYGKYCGIGYTGCPGELPCDGLDTCCLAHDRCISETGNVLGLHTECNKELLKCVEAFEKSGNPQFRGACPLSQVGHTIEVIMKTAISLGEEAANINGAV